MPMEIKYKTTDLEVLNLLFDLLALLDHLSALQ